MNKKEDCLYLVYHSNTTGGEISPGDEDMDYPSHEPTQHTFEPEFLCRSTESLYWVETIKVDESLKTFDKLFMLVARYSSGDSFGSTYGNWAVVGLFETLEQAEAERIKVVNDKETLYPWVGYFESLEGFEIHKLNVMDKYQPNWERDKPGVRFFDHT